MQDRRSIFQTAQQIQQIQHIVKHQGETISNISSIENIEEQPIIEKLDIIIEDLEVIANEINNPTPPSEELKEAVKEYKIKNKNTDGEKI